MAGGLPTPNISFDLSAKRSKSTSNTTTNSTANSTFNNTTTPIVPGWADGLVQGAARRVGGLFDASPESYVAPANTLQTRAAQDAAGLNDSHWTYDAANSVMSQEAGAGPSQYSAQSYGGATVAPVTTAQAGSLLQNLNSYMSPYRQQVVDSALADFDTGAGRTRAQLDLDLAGSGAFGGSGAALSKSMTEGELARGRATTSANLLDQMFNRGAQLSNLDADRRNQVSMANSQAANTAALTQAQLSQQAGMAQADAANNAAQFNATQTETARRRRMDAATGMTNIASAYGANQQANIRTQAEVGDMMRGVDNQIRQAPLTTTQQIVASLSGLPINLFVGQNEQGAKSETENQTVNQVTKGSEVGAGVKVGW